MAVSSIVKSPYLLVCLCILVKIGCVCHLQLESLKKGENIYKDDDGVTLLANTYDPDVDPKSTKSNRQRQQHIINSKYSLLFCTKCSRLLFLADCRELNI